MDRSTLAPNHPGYPASLRLLKQPPTLRVRGALPAKPGVAVVGTREPSPEGAKFAFDVGRALALAGVPVLSGGAVGVDTAAHRGALDGGGLTVAILGGGLDRIFPRENSALFEEIAARGGAVIAPCDDDVAPAPFRFHLRNSVLATLSSLLVLVECGLVSGALNATQWARTFGVPWAVVPNAPWSTTGAGCALELTRGGRVVTSPRSVVRLYREILGLPTHEVRAPPKSRRTGAPKKSAAQASLGLGLTLEVSDDDPSIRAILEAIDRPASIGDLAERLGASTGELAERLLELAFDGRVEEVSPGVYRRATLSLGRPSERE